MSEPVKLTVTLEQYDEMHRVLERARGKGEFVKVSREALTKFFVDHTRLLQRVPHRDPDGKVLKK